MKFNKEQQLAIDTIDRNVCVVAGAGTGKTAILSHRFINIIKKYKLQGKEAMEKILAITFTKKATNEMIDRIAKEILNLEEKDPSFRGLYNHLAFLKVSTIDSFCQSIIKENTFKIGLPSDYKIIEETEAKLILDQIVKEVFNNYLALDKNLESFLVKKNYSNPKIILEELKNIYKKIQSKGYDFDQLFMANPLNNLESINIEEFSSNLNFFIEDLKSLKIVNGRHAIVKKIKDGILEKLTLDDENIVRESLYDIKDALEKISSKADIGYLHNELEKIILNFEKEDLVYYDLINSMLKDIDEKFRQEKKKLGLVEFSDLLYYTDLLLQYPEILEDVRNKYQYIMIDEFQDTNQYQKKIFYKIASKEKELDRNNLFVVGDPKQSIYGFRGSDLKVFHDVKEDIEKSGGLVVELKENFRSSQSLVAYANTLFSKLLKENYTELTAKIPWAKEKENNKKVQFIQIEDEEISEGEIVARKILQLKNSGKDLSDIGVLFRSSTRLSELEFSLSKYNIPYINPKSRDFYNKREILDLILLFKFLNNPQDSEALYGLLRSNFFLIEDNSLFKLAKSADDSLFNNLLAYKGQEDVLNYAKDVLLKTLSMKDKTSIYELFRSFVSSCYYYEFLKTTKNTKQEIENIKKFEELIIYYEENISSSINEFIEYLLIEEKDDLNEALVLSNQGAVNLMTIHASKGLEFDTVIFYDSQNSAQKERSTLILSEKYGYGIRTSDKSTAFSIIQADNFNDEQDERNRLLYVCVTRAKKEFIFISVKQKPFESDQELDQSSFLSTLATLADYEYELVEEIPNIPPVKKTIKMITTDQSQVKKKKSFLKEKTKRTSSISAYMVFKRCPREYYYKYNLALDEDQLNEEFFLDEDNINKDFSNKNNSNIKVDGKTYGSLVHSIIENSQSFDQVQDLINIKIKEFGLEENENLINRLRKNIMAYEENKFQGQKYFEFPFLLDLDQGFLSGSIDQIVVEDDGIKIIDFKTNKHGDIESLVNIYKDQVLIYSLAAEKIFNCKVKSGFLLFLEHNKLVEIPLDKDLLEKLKKDLKSFLRFIGDNDSIEKYNYCQSCSDNCKYKILCNRW